MSRPIIIQPNGLYCIFSTIIDGMLVYDCTREEVIQFFVDEQKAKITMLVDNRISDIEAGVKTYHQFELSYEQASKLSAGIIADDEGLI
jgi:hypothetical protein